MRVDFLNIDSIYKPSKYRLPLWLIRILHYEYWPFYIFYLPVFVYYLWLSIKSKSLTWIAIANPAITYGGLIGESKYEILKLVDEKYLPVTLSINKQQPVEEVLLCISERKLDYPVICKPDVGERGKGVAKIYSEKELANYHNNEVGNYIIQEFIDYEIELGVFYYCYPDKSKSDITSITGKKFLSVIGNGMNTVQELMQQNDRARFQISRMWNYIGEDGMNEILNKGNIKILEPIGNHSRGTYFTNENKLINKQLVNVFDKIIENIHGFNYGRLDIRVKSLEQLYIGESIKIMEINGVSSEPGHIYDQESMNLFSAWRDLLSHYTILNKIASINYKNGIHYPSLKKIIKQLKTHL